MKNVVFSDKVKQTPDLYTKAVRATEVLDRVLGTSADQVAAKWDAPEDDKSGRLLTLRISDWTGARSATLETSELEQPTQLGFRFYRLWGDLLQDRNEKQLRELLGTSGPGE